ncbi:hypothetical protein BC629DRAFT_883423 [Irpex lacteus]|nr:hypothetical protein BC629DRAFT_883423 [Irpex lacteus]
MPTEAAKCLQTSTITKFPDELINHILAALGTDNWEDTHQGLPEKNNWLPCALVCRRWYRITLPHLFRFVCISPKSPGDPYDFYQFLVGKPLARLVDNPRSQGSRTATSKSTPTQTGHVLTVGRI